MPAVLRRLRWFVTIALFACVVGVPAALAEAPTGEVASGYAVEAARGQVAAGEARRSAAVTATRVAASASSHRELPREPEPEPEPVPEDSVEDGAEAQVALPPVRGPPPLRAAPRAPEELARTAARHVTARAVRGAPGARAPPAT